jgi:hypothetical protein
MRLTKLIQGVTSDSDLITLADSLGIRVDDIVTIDNIRRPLDKRRTYIILLRVEQGVGHWVTVDKGYYFDPMGVPSDPSLGVTENNHKQYQGTYNTYCGIYCLLFLYCRQKNKMDLLDQFVDLNNRDFEWDYERRRLCPLVVHRASYESSCCL